MSLRFSLSGKGKAPPGSKARAEQDAKAREEEAARKRVLAEYLDEHGADDNVANDASKTTNPLRSDDRTDPSVFVPQGAKRHFAYKQRSANSGPGTLKDEPFDAFPRTTPTNRFGRREPGRTGTNPQFPDKREENVYTTVVATASNLPPDIDESTVEKLFADFPDLKVIKVEKLPTSGPAQKRASVAMKITFDQDARARHLDVAINKMSDKKYLGQGYYLHLDRYLGRRTAKEPEKMPFGARWVAPDTSARFAPTAELGGSSDRTRTREREERERKVITAYPPPDLPTLKLIHHTIEGVLAGGMEFEAALMQDPRVKSDEKWAWIFDQSHPLNRYYRFRIYQLTTGDKSTKVEIFPGMGEWHGSPPLPDEFAYRLQSLSPGVEELKPDLDDDSGRRQKFADSYPGMVDTGNGFMSPKARALLTYLLATVPISKSQVTNEVIATVTFFAVTNANAGMDEIIDLIITNIFEPFSLSPTNPKYRHRDENDSKLNNDRREATLNALRIVSDLSFTANRAGGKSYKYRHAIGTQLVERKVFEYLESLPARLRMGKFAVNNFKTDVNYIIRVWEGDHLFETKVLEHIDVAFNEKQRQKEEEDKQRKQEEQHSKVIKNPKPGSKNPYPKVDGGFDGSDETNNREINDTSGFGSTNPELQRDSLNVARQQIAMGTQLTHISTEDRQISTERQQIATESRQRSTQSQQEPTEKQQLQKKSSSGSDTSKLDPSDTRSKDSNHAASSDITREAEGTGTPGETAAARARRLRPKAEDMFASDDECR
jgi:U2-associated protein SR140